MLKCLKKWLENKRVRYLRDFVIREQYDLISFDFICSLFQTKRLLFHMARHIFNGVSLVLIPDLGQSI